MLARLEGLEGERAVEVVARGDDDEVDVGVGQDAIERRSSEYAAPNCVAAAVALWPVRLTIACRRRSLLMAWMFGRCIPRANDPAPTTATPIAPVLPGRWVGVGTTRAPIARFVGGIRQQDDDGPVRRTEPGVRGGGLLDRVGRADQGLERDAAVGDQAQVFRHVAVLGPAHVPDRVVEPALLVVPVVATGAV